MSPKLLHITRNFHVVYLKRCVFDLCSISYVKTVLNPISWPFLVHFLLPRKFGSDGSLYKRSILCRLDVDFLKVLLTSLALALTLDFVAREIRSTCGKSSFSIWSSQSTSFSTFRSSRYRHLSVWQTFLQASDFFPGITDTCIVLVERFRNLSISEFPFDFFEPVVPRFSVDYQVNPWDKWLRF